MGFDQNLKNLENSCLGFDRETERSKQRQN